MDPLWDKSDLVGEEVQDLPGRQLWAQSYSMTKLLLLHCLKSWFLETEGLLFLVAEVGKDLVERVRVLDHKVVSVGEVDKEILESLL